MVTVVERLMDTLVEVEDQLGDRGVKSAVDSLKSHIKSIEERINKN